jgi:hypothetical protein
MSMEDILVTAQDYLLQMGEAITLDASVPEMVETLARLIPVFGQVGVVYNIWQVGQYIAADGTYADLTALAQGPGDFSVTTTTVLDGLLIGASGAYDQVTFGLTSGALGTAPQYEWTYWNGRAWLPLRLTIQPTFAAPGVEMLAFLPPDDWVPDVPTDIVWPAGVEQTAFWLRLRALVPPELSPATCSTLSLTIRFFPLPTNVLQLLSVHFFPRELEPAGVRWAQDTLDPAWRTRTGVPTRYTQELETTQRLRLHPSPTMQGAMGLPPFQGIPGASAPTNHLVTLTLEAPNVADLAPWWEDLVAYLLAAWEATREGLRQDAAQAQALQTLVALLVGLLKDLHHAPGEELVSTAWQMPYWMHLPLGREP